MNEDKKTGEEKKTKQTVIICAAVIAAAVIIAAAAVYSNRTKNVSADSAAEQTETEAETAEAEEIETETEADAATADETAADTAKQQTEQPKEQKTAVKYYSGTYHITSSDKPGDKEMPQGEYVLQPDRAEGYFELAKDLSEESDSIITNGGYNVRTYVTVSDGQYLTFEGVAIPIEDADAYIPKNGQYDSQAMYKVGFDIQPGEYNAVIKADETDEGPAEGKIITLSSSDGDESSVISETVLEEDRVIALEDNTYIILDGLTLSEAAG